MTFLSSLLTWANVPFVVALGVAVTFVLLQVSGLLGLLAGGGDHEGDTDADHEADTGSADGDADADADADGDADADADADNEGEAHQAHGGAGKEFLAGMGVGTMPLSIVWQSFAVCFAFGGITANTVYFSYAHALPTAALAVSAPVALAFAYLATRGVSKVFGRLAPAAGKTSTSRRDLVGKAGVVISSKVNAEFGEVRVTDPTGIVHRVICRVHPDEAPIPEGREVVFVEHDRARDLLFVAPLDADPPPRRPRLRVAAPPPDTRSKGGSTPADGGPEAEPATPDEAVPGEAPAKAAS